MTALIPVIYVVGASRSGSTILDLALGEYADITSTGELRNLAKFGLRDHGRCGCGELFDDCLFWAEVRDRGSREFKELWRQPAAVVTSKEAGSRLRHFRAMAHRGMAPPAGAVHRRFTQLLYQALANVTGGVLVDSSKSPVGALELYRMETTNGLFVHLIRDPRGVALSAASKRVQAAAPSGRLMARNPVWRSSLDWELVNGQVRHLQRIVGRQRTVTLRYEDVVADPLGSLESILDRAKELGLVSEVPSHVGAQVQHTAWGNPVRLGLAGVEWKLDERWVSDLSRADSRAVELLTVRGRRRYDYKVR